MSYQTEYDHSMKDPEGFWRKGNVDIVCERYGAVMTSTLEEMIAHLTAQID